MYASEPLTTGMRASTVQAEVPSASSSKRARAPLDK